MIFAHHLRSKYRSDRNIARLSRISFAHANIADADARQRQQKGFLMKNMNLPNKLTLLRIAFVPVIMALMLIEFPLHYLAAGLLFGAAAITDAFDGKIARRDNLITNFGKFADPLADKILVISALVCFVKFGLCGAIPLVIIVLREFAVSAIRLVAAANGKVIAANMWGKVKTVAQIVAIVAVFVFQTVFDLICLISYGETYTAGEMYILNQAPFHADIVTAYNVLNIIGQALIWISAVFTVISGVKYLLDNKEVINDM